MILKESGVSITQLVFASVYAFKVEWCSWVGRWWCENG